jgi:tetratricopeptide (TPR) repeat protein
MVKMRRLPLCIVAAAACLMALPTPQNSSQPKMVPASTSSADARVKFERGIAAIENLQLGPALDEFRAASKADGNFALAHLFVAYSTTEPAEESRELAAARRLAAGGSRGEKLLISWIAGARENDYVTAIAAMNDLLHDFPDDPRIGFLAGRWLILQRRYEQGQKLLERALAADQNYPAVLNELGYSYAFSRNYDKAFEVMARYAALLPNEPNPHDSWGEVCRMAGHYDQALEHYRAALKIDPKFSLLGIADTYALMGEGEKARTAYAEAIANAPTKGDAVDYALQSALTYVREMKFSQADKAFEQVAEKARALGMARRRATAYRSMAMYATSATAATKSLDRAEAALAADPKMAKSDRAEEHAQILYARALKSRFAAGRAGATNSVAELARMAATSRSNVIQRSYHGAAGALLYSQGKMAQAIPHLEEDVVNPISAGLLAAAYEKTSAMEDARELRHRLASFHEPTLENALASSDSGKIASR